MIDQENEQNQPSGESAVQPHGCGGLADQVERLDKELKYLYHTVDVIEGTQRRILDQLDEVLPVQATKEASEDWLSELREMINQWMEVVSEKSVSERGHGIDDGMEWCASELGKWIANRSASNNTSEGSDGSLVA